MSYHFTKNYNLYLPDYCPDFEVEWFHYQPRVARFIGKNCAEIIPPDDGTILFSFRCEDGSVDYYLDPDITRQGEGNYYVWARDQWVPFVPGLICSDNPIRRRSDIEASREQFGS